MLFKNLLLGKTLNPSAWIGCLFSFSAIGSHVSHSFKKLIVWWCEFFNPKPLLIEILWNEIATRLLSSEVYWSRIISVSFSIRTSVIRNCNTGWIIALLETLVCQFYDFGLHMSQPPSLLWFDEVYWIWILLYLEDLTMRTINLLKYVVLIMSNEQDNLIMNCFGCLGCSPICRWHHRSLIHSSPSSSSSSPSSSSSSSSFSSLACLYYTPPYHLPYCMETRSVRISRLGDNRPESVVRAQPCNPIIMIDLSANPVIFGKWYFSCLITSRLDFYVQWMGMSFPIAFLWGSTLNRESGD